MRQHVNPLSKNFNEIEIRQSISSGTFGNAVADLLKNNTQFIKDATKATGSTNVTVRSTLVDITNSIVSGFKFMVGQFGLGFIGVIAGFVLVVLGLFGAFSSDQTIVEYEEESDDEEEE